MAFVEFTRRVVGTGSIVIRDGGAVIVEAIGSGGKGGTASALLNGGAGAGGSYARTNALSTTANQTLNFNVSPINTAGKGQSSWVSTTTSAPTSVTQGCLAEGGAAGTNATLTAGGTGGTGTTANSIGNVLFSGGSGANNGGGGGAGSTGVGGPGGAQAGVGGAGTPEMGGNGGGTVTGGAGLPGNQAGGGGAAGQTLNVGGNGGPGIVRITFSTGTGTISHTARFNRRITAFRRVVASITHTAIFDRKVTLRRMFTASVTHVSRALKTIKLRKTASVTHLAAYTRKALRLRKTANIVHMAFLRRFLRFTKIASIVHTPVFKRLVTLRRRFVASITLRARMLVKLEARLIPREGGGGTVTNVFRNLFLFDD